MNSRQFMRRVACFMILGGALLCTVISARADERSEVLLRRLAEAFRTKDNYSVRFEVLAGEATYAGRYDVDGDTFYMTVNGAEVFSDGHTRYEVNPERKEVIVDAVDTASRNLLENPTRAFDFLDGQFADEFLGERAEGSLVRLVPVDKHAAVGAIDVCIDSSNGLPRSVVYRIDGDTVTIRVREIVTGKTPPAPFNGTAYSGYEFIDFR